MIQTNTALTVCCEWHWYLPGAESAVICDGVGHRRYFFSRDPDVRGARTRQEYFDFTFRIPTLYGRLPEVMGFPLRTIAIKGA